MLSAVLLGGWLLMTPPYEGKLDGTPRHLNHDAPIEKWSHVRSFDSAQGCEQPKSVLLEKNLKTKESGFQAWFSARCIPAEHIYPPKK